VSWVRSSATWIMHTNRHPRHWSLAT